MGSQSVPAIDGIDTRAVVRRVNRRAGFAATRHPGNNFASLPGRAFGNDFAGLTGREGHSFGFAGTARVETVLRAQTGFSYKSGTCATGSFGRHCN